MRKTHFIQLSIAVLCLINSKLHAQNPQFPLINGGWIGGDGAYSIALNDTTRLWLFGDSWIGELKDNKRHNATMVNNAVGIEHPGKPVQYYYRGPKTAFFINTRPKEWYWPMDGIRIGEKLYVVVSRLYMQDSTNITGFGFATSGQDLAIIQPDSADPLQWKIEYKPIPTTMPRIGAAVARDARYIYFFGDDQSNKHTTYLARIPAGSITDFAKFEYFYPKTQQWMAEFGKATYLFDAAPEFSVRYNDAAKKWVAIYIRGWMSKDITMRTAKNITGPWGDEKVIAECPELAWSKNYYAYEAKQVAPLKGEKTDKLTLTYLVNALSLWDVAKDLRIYVPQVVGPLTP